MFKRIKNLPKLVKLTYLGWKEDNGSRLAAALTYYTVFSLAPMLIIAIAAAGCTRPGNKSGSGFDWTPGKNIYRGSPG
jgi:uncharacterized BrkB/YihY/UPF0761 family membrane protein